MLITFYVFFLQLLYSRSLPHREFIGASFMDNGSDQTSIEMDTPLILANPQIDISEYESKLSETEGGWVSVTFISLPCSKFCNFICMLTCVPFSY